MKWMNKRDLIMNDNFWHNFVKEMRSLNIAQIFEKDIYGSDSDSIEEIAPRFVKDIN